MYVSVTRNGGTVYSCNNDDAQETNGWYSDYNLVQIATNPNPLKDLEEPKQLAANNPPAKNFVTESTLNKDGDKKDEKKEEQKEEQKEEEKKDQGWAPTDPRVNQIKLALREKPYSPWGSTPYKMTLMWWDYPDRRDKYFAEYTKNEYTSSKKFTFKFRPEWKVVSHEHNEFSIVLQPGAEVYYCAKFVDANTPFSWSLYSREITDA